MSRWFRHYAGMMRDEKLVSAALRAKQSVERVIWIWGAILETAAELNDGGRYDLDAAEAAYFLRTDEADICAIVNALTDSGRLAEGRVVNWGTRQFQSDRSAPRQAAYRERKRSQDGHGDDRQENGDGEVTAALRHCDAPDTETELETEKKEDIRAVAKATRPKTDESFEGFWKAYPRRAGANPKSPAWKVFRTFVASGVEPQSIIDGARRCAEIERGKVNTEFIPQAVKWLRDRRWEDYLADAARVQTIAPTGFYAAENSPELDAWDTYWRATKGTNAMRDRNGGWRFPERWPPGYQAEQAA